MVRWFEQRPGSEESLLALYDAVVAAEEFDLAEQAVVDRWRHADEVDPVVLDSEEYPLEPEVLDDRPSMSQAVALIEHLLGGRRLRPSG